MIHPQAQPRGFTLTELIVVMIVICIAMAIVAPSFRGFSESSQSRDAVAQLVAMAHWARSQAVVQGRVYRLNIDTGGSAYWLTVQEQEEFVSLGTDLGRKFSLPEGSRLALARQVEPERDSVDFFPNGRTDMATVSLFDRSGTETKIGCPSPTELFRVLDGEAK